MQRLATSLLQRHRAQLGASGITGGNMGDNKPFDIVSPPGPQTNNGTAPPKRPASKARARPRRRSRTRGKPNPRRRASRTRKPRPAGKKALNKKKNNKRRPSRKRTKPVTTGRKAPAKVIPPLHLDVTVNVEQGARDYQEDRHYHGELPAPFNHLYLFLVCDGHGGDTCSEYVKTNLVKKIHELLHDKAAKKVANPNLPHLLKTAIQSVCLAWTTWALGPGGKSIVDSRTRKAYFDQVDLDRFNETGRDSGTTVCCALLDTVSGKLHVANLGDSRCILRAGSEIHATRDHSVPKSAPRIQGYNLTYDDGRVCGDVAMTRSIGDLTPELTGVVGRTPDLYTYKLRSAKSSVSPLTTDQTDATIVIASDGLFDIVNTQNVLLNHHSHAKDIMAEAKEAGEDGLHDNTTIILANIHFDNPRGGTGGGNQHRQSKVTTPTPPQVTSLVSSATPKPPLPPIATINHGGYAKTLLL